MSVDNTLGAAYIGVVVAALLYGVSCVQAWYYFTHQKDTWPLKSIVAAVMIFDAVHQVLITHTVYDYLVTNYDNPARMADLVWSLVVEVIFTGLTALLVQAFLTMRVWHLSNKNIWLTGAVTLLVVGEFVTVIVYTGFAMTYRKFFELQEIKSLQLLINILAAAGDVLITIILCTYLHRARTQFSRSNVMIDKLILFAVNTGFLTSLCAVASLITSLVLPNTFIYIAFYVCIGRLYANSLLATLNARKMIRRTSEGLSTTEGSARLPQFRNSGTVNTKFTNLAIKVDTTRESSTTDSRQDSFIEKRNSGLTLPCTPTTPTSPTVDRISREIRFSV